MEQLGIALAGVIVGAFVSEGLRYWYGRAESKRRLKGALRLVRDEMITNATFLVGEQATPAVIRERLRGKSISADQWLANEALLAESLPTNEWLYISAATIGVRMLIVEVDLTEDDELLLIAKEVAQRLEKATHHLDSGRMRARI